MSVAAKKLTSSRGAIQQKFSSSVQLTGVERSFKPHELIVSKTDAKGRITYANDVFLRLAGISEDEAIGAPHSIVRHPHMPRCVFRLLWQTIEKGEEIFAYVVNMAKNGDHYWVFAHVTPSLSASGEIVGYHSNRRVPSRQALQVIEPLYAQLRDVEKNAASRGDGVEAGVAHLLNLLASKGVSYEQFIFSL